MYRTDVYFLCKTLAELVIFVFFPMVSFAIPYYAIGLNPPVERLFIGAGIVVMITNVATSFGKLNAAFCNFRSSKESSIAARAHKAHNVAVFFCEQVTSYLA